MNQYLQIIVLAVIQGLAELLPVSSSAHVIVAEKLMGLDPSAPEQTFLLVMLHTGTMVAVLFYFWKRWKPLLSATVEVKGRPVRHHFIKMIVLATAFTGVLGLGLKYAIEKIVMIKILGHEKGEIEHLFKSLPLISSSLMCVGIFIIVAGMVKPVSWNVGLTPWSSSLIGIVQGMCLPFRGFSRSGATISTGLLTGVPRALAEDFSFALAVVLTPPVIALELYRLLKAWPSGKSLFDLMLPGCVGMVFSFLAGLIALRVLSAALEKGRWMYFGFYCIAASIGVFVAAMSGL